jgi:hypothetical protein
MTLVKTQVRAPVAVLADGRTAIAPPALSDCGCRSRYVKSE